MSHGIKRRIKIQELLIEGYKQEEIAKKLNVSLRTVVRDIKKIRLGNERWLDELFPKEMINLFREGLEGIKKDMSTLREMLNEESVKEDVSLKLKILKGISELRNNYLEMLTKTPLVWSSNIFAKKNELKRNDGKPLKSTYGELRGYEYRESSSESQSN